jgi:hypothetical protein
MPVAVITGSAGLIGAEAACGVDGRSYVRGVLLEEISGAA